MNAAQRREKILQQLHGASAPISASALAAKLGVSRQIVVGDVDLLRAGGAEIEATPRGYQFHPTPGGYTGILACVHRSLILIFSSGWRARSSMNAFSMARSVFSMRMSKIINHFHCFVGYPTLFVFRG